ncbi:MAG: xanthine dehydrogenase family protein molybdopterin-binding subunit, partial [bacterium]
MSAWAVGKRTPRIDSIGKVTGKAIYADDIKLPGMLYGKVVRTKYPHAKILNIDISEAKRVKGVEAVLTAKDIPGVNRVGVAITKDQPIIADDKVRYMGDALAIIAAHDLRTAQFAASLIKVEYEVLPVIEDPEEALFEASVKIHDKGNLICHHKVRKGNIDAGFSEADIIVERKFETQMVEHSYIEPESAIAEPLDDGGVRVFGCMQNIYTSRRILAQVLNLPMNKVVCVQTTMGGSFGGKDDAMNILACRVALLALATGKPVKITYTRDESMIDSYKRHPYKMYYRVGLKNDGTITAAEIKIYANGGAYASMSEFV